MIFSHTEEDEKWKKHSNFQFMELKKRAKNFFCEKNRNIINHAFQAFQSRKIFVCFSLFFQPFQSLALRKTKK